MRGHIQYLLIALTILVASFSSQFSTAQAQS
jgi:hypothetical protein